MKRVRPGTAFKGHRRHFRYFFLQGGEPTLIGSVGFKGISLNVMTTPLVSVCVPTYNGGQYLEDALASILSQSFRDFEIVVSDDASSDMTLEIVDRFCRQFEGKTRIIHHKPCGIGANWNSAVFHSHGKYIKFLMQDDLLEPCCIASMVDAFERHPNVGLVFGRRAIIDGGSRTDVDRWTSIYGSLHKAWSNPLSDGVLSGHALLGDQRLLDRPENKIGEPSVVMFSRSVVDKVGYFHEGMRQLLDVEYWYRVLRHFDAVFINRELASFRLHIGQASRANKFAHYNYDEEILKLWLSYISNIWSCLAPSVKREVLKNLFRSGGKSIFRRFRWAMRLRP